MQEEKIYSSPLNSLIYHLLTANNANKLYRKYFGLFLTVLHQAMATLIQQMVTVNLKNIKDNIFKSQEVDGICARETEA